MLLGFDIGGTNLKAGLVDLTGKIVRTDSIPTPDSIIDFRKLSDTLLSRVAAGAQLLGAGIGCPGVINPVDTKVENLPGKMSYLEGFTLSDLVPRWLPEGVSVCADNDARAALAGELMFGSARGKKNVLMLTLGSGVGGAIAVNGALILGPASTSAIGAQESEFRHLSFKILDSFFVKSSWLPMGSLKSPEAYAKVLMDLV